MKEKDWFLDENGEERTGDAMLGFLRDSEILGLADSYDDTRIDVLVTSYLTLRRRMQKIMNVYEEMVEDAH